jgi:hypothetical protein
VCACVHPDETQMMSYYDDWRSSGIDGWMEVRIGGLVGALPVRWVLMGWAGPHFA